VEFFYAIEIPDIFEIGVVSEFTTQLVISFDIQIERFRFG
jgi:hypothetical protein